MRIAISLSNRSTPGAVMECEEIEIAERPDGGYNGTAVAHAVSSFLCRRSFAIGDVITVEKAPEYFKP